MIRLPGYNAPLTAGHFLDLVDRGYYNDKPINRADGFLVQAGAASGGSPPSSPIPLEIRVANAGPGVPPEYGMTFEDLGMYQDSPQLNFNALGSLGMAHSEGNANDANTQFFWAIPDPRQGSLLDGRFAVRHRRRAIPAPARGGSPRGRRLRKRPHPGHADGSRCRSWRPGWARWRSPVPRHASERDG